MNESDVEKEIRTACVKACEARGYPQPSATVWIEKDTRDEVLALAKKLFDEMAEQGIVWIYEEAIEIAARAIVKQVKPKDRMIARLKKALATTDYRFMEMHDREMEYKTRVTDRLQEEIKRLRANLAMHSKPKLCVWGRVRNNDCEMAIRLLEKSGLDFEVVEVGIDPTGEAPMVPYLICDCPGGSGLDKIEKLVRRAVPFVKT